MKLSRLSCQKCGRHWYMEVVGKSLTEVGTMLSSIGCVTKGCAGSVLIHAGEIEAYTKGDDEASGPIEYEGETDPLPDHRTFQANIVNRGRMKPKGDDER